MTKAEQIENATRRIMNNIRLPIAQTEKIPISNCIKGRVYRLNCRNLSYGVFNGLTEGREGFIGIREKFGRRYLDTEYHWDTGEPFGTVSGMIDSEVDVPAGIEIEEYINYRDLVTGRAIYYDKTLPYPDILTRPTDGWWRYSDTHEICPARYKNEGGKLVKIEPPPFENKWDANTALFDFLDTFKVAIAARAVLMMLIHADGKPTIDEAAAILAVDREQLDSEFGVRLIDPKANQYAVRCRVEDSMPEGAFSDPKIDTF